MIYTSGCSAPGVVAGGKTNRQERETERAREREGYSSALRCRSFCCLMGGAILRFSWCYYYCALIVLWTRDEGNNNNKSFRASSKKRKTATCTLSPLIHPPPLLKNPFCYGSTAVILFFFAQCVPCHTVFNRPKTKTPSRRVDFRTQL